MTLALTLVTFVASHYVGIKDQRRGHVLQALGARRRRRPLQPVPGVLEVLSQFLRLVSLSVRLFANMLAGHLLIIMSRLS